MGQQMMRLDGLQRNVTNLYNQRGVSPGSFKRMMEGHAIRKPTPKHLSNIPELNALGWTQELIESAYQNS